MKLTKEETKWKWESHRELDLCDVYCKATLSILFSTVSIIFFLLFTISVKYLGQDVLGAIVGVPIALVYVITGIGAFFSSCDFFSSARKYWTMSSFKTLIQDVFCMENIQEFKGTRKFW